MNGMKTNINTASAQRKPVYGKIGLLPQSNTSHTVNNQIVVPKPIVIRRTLAPVSPRSCASNPAEQHEEEIKADGNKSNNALINKQQKHSIFLAPMEPLVLSFSEKKIQNRDKRNESPSKTKKGAFFIPVAKRGAFVRASKISTSTVSQKTEGSHFCSNPPVETKENTHLPSACSTQIKMTHEYPRTTTRTGTVTSTIENFRHCPGDHIDENGTNVVYEVGTTSTSTTTTDVSDIHVKGLELVISTNVNHSSASDTSTVRNTIVNELPVLIRKPEATRNCKSTSSYVCEKKDRNLPPSTKEHNTEIVTPDPRKCKITTVNPVNVSTKTAHNSTNRDCSTGAVVKVNTLKKKNSRTANLVLPIATRVSTIANNPNRTPVATQAVSHTPKISKDISRSEQSRRNLAQSRLTASTLKRAQQEQFRKKHYQQCAFPTHQYHRCNKNNMGSSTGPNMSNGVAPTTNNPTNISNSAQIQFHNPKPSRTANSTSEQPNNNNNGRFLPPYHHTQPQHHVLSNTSAQQQPPQANPGARATTSLNVSSPQLANRGSVDSSSVAPPQPLFERLIVEEAQESKTYTRIIESQNRRLTDLERIHMDLERRLEVLSKERNSLEANLEERDMEYKQKLLGLEKERDSWKKVVTSERMKNERLLDQVHRKDKEIHRMIQRKYDGNTHANTRNLPHNPHHQANHSNTIPLHHSRISPNSSIGGSPAACVKEGEGQIVHRGPHDVIRECGSSATVRERNVTNLLLDFFGM